MLSLFLVQHESDLHRAQCAESIRRGRRLVSDFHSNVFVDVHTSATNDTEDRNDEAGGVSDYYSPNTLMGLGVPDYKKHFEFSFGAHVQANEETTNTPRARTLDAIYLGPTNNIQGGHDVMNLATGRVITRSQVTEIPLYACMIEAVEHLAKTEGFKQLTFTAKDGTILADSDLLTGVDRDNELN